MNIALIGYGRMGHEIEAMAIKRGHKVPVKIDLNNVSEFVSENFRDIDVAIEFSSPETAFSNVRKCLEMKIPVVSGTTGWTADYPKAVELCNQHGGSFIHSSNFSIGVNILFRLNSELARLLEKQSDYVPFIEEVHHTKKLDAPSGTAITLANGILKSKSGLNGWCLEGAEKDDNLVIRAVREGEVPGTHTVEWESEIDKISLRHEAKGRKGFAAGSVLAAEYISGRKGVFTMSDVLGF
jgi:4-hydroxy-tetrahydrodipicolinate reductase